ncbi:phosphoenolpyruvate carboxykinase (GTP) [Candidatus Falkowbacteria bacterium]|nr:phosphoenolpyruvate carboxykinase (GTP) [Candidatus Falkowbacteria bacterium]
MKLEELNHRELERWIREMAALCAASEIIIVDGSEEQRKKLIERALQNEELIKLDQDKYPNCYYHRSSPTDVARTEHLTFICTPNEDQAGPTNNWMSPKIAYEKARAIFEDSMRGRAMYVIPFSMGPIGSPRSKIGVELTDSLYVVLSMLIMTRAGKEVLDVLGIDGEFTRCMHGLAERDPKKRLILHFPQDNTIWSVGSGYGGNALLGKKCLALRIASHQARQENWLAEHMLIMGIGDPDGNTTFITGAFPSACGKTNLAMLIPPEQFKKKWSIWTMGDDIGWLFPETNGWLWAINPENGMFGVAPGTNHQSNPNAMKTIESDTIFTNVVLNSDGHVWWEELDDEPPTDGVNWQGLPWYLGMKDAKGNIINGAHPNSRFTAPIKNCPSKSQRTDWPNGVQISAILFGGRRNTLAPLVYEARDWEHGVYIATTMSSEVTAAQERGQGEVRYDPMAMLPFIGYNINDYLSHWLRFGKRLKHPPRIFHVNWFRKGENGQYLWPGYGDNLRVLQWIVKRVHGQVAAIETPIGFMPRPEDLDLAGLNIGEKELNLLFRVDKDEWMIELELREKFLEKLGMTLPVSIYKQHLLLKERIEKM